MNRAEILRKAEANEGLTVKEINRLDDCQSSRISARC